MCRIASHDKDKEGWRSKSLANIQREYRQRLKEKDEEAAMEWVCSFLTAHQHKKAI